MLNLAVKQQKDVRTFVVVLEAGKVSADWPQGNVGSVDK
jgi:hypothetical protein